VAPLNATSSLSDPIAAEPTITSPAAEVPDENQGMLSMPFFFNHISS